MKLSKETIEEINKQQKNRSLHPLTCCGPGDIPECKRNESYKRRALGDEVDFSADNEGVLVATEEGLICPCGKYKQNYRVTIL